MTAPIKLDTAALERLKTEDPALYEECLRDLAELDEIKEQDPLQFFVPHAKQQQFGLARTKVQAAAAGNRFGKTTIGTVKSLCQLVPREMVPGRLLPFRQVGDGPAFGRVVGPDFKAWGGGVLLPVMRKWAPVASLRGGSFDSAWDKQRWVLHFANGSWLQVMTYEMDLDKFGGAALHFCWYDEPPRPDIREECAWRLIDHGGFEMFTYTPLDANGANVAYLYREVWRKREHPDFTVIQGSIHDNPALDEEEIAKRLAGRDPDDPERMAREHGAHVPFGGLVYPGGFDRRLIDPLAAADIKGLDVVCGIDPGLRFAAFVWIAFHKDNFAFVFDELLLKGGTPTDYARELKARQERWGLREPPMYVVDPSSDNGVLVDSKESVVTELMRRGIFCALGENTVDPGIQQVQDRLKYGRLKVASNCVQLRAQAEEYPYEQKPDGTVKPAKGNDHLLDALRYGLMSRVWMPEMDEAIAGERLGFTPDFEGPYRPVAEPEPVGPMGPWS